MLWLLDDYIKEMTILNVFILQMSRYGHLELLTPPDDGCILNGITRQTIIDLKGEIKKKFNVVVEERQVSIHEVINSYREERLISMFGASTHCPLLPISRVVYKDQTINIRNEGFKFNDKLNNMLTHLMTADPSTSPWLTKMED